MDSFKVWLFSLSGATAITALFRLLLSNSSLTKVLNIFFTLFVLFYTVTPIQSFIDYHVLSDVSTDTQLEYNEIYKSGYEQIIEISIKNECQKLDVEVLSCDILSALDSDGILNVESIVVEINNEKKAERVKENIKEQLGYEVVVK